jgi:hypothetical protein
MAVFTVDYRNFTFRGQSARIQAAVDLSDQLRGGASAIPEDILGIPTYLGCFRVAASPNQKVRHSSLTAGSRGGRSAAKCGSFTPATNLTSKRSDHGDWDPGTYGMNYATAPEGTIVGKWLAAGHKTRRGTYLNNRGPLL